MIIMAKKKAKSVSNDEQIGFHKGALSTLAKEREEFLKILKVTIPKKFQSPVSYYFLLWLCYLFC